MTFARRLAGGFRFAPMWADRRQRKRAETISRRPLFNLVGLRHRGNHLPPQIAGATSMLPRRLEGRVVFLDGLLVVPASAADHLVHAGGIAINRRFGLAVATTAETRTAPDRELIDLGRSLMESCTHTWLLWPVRFKSMVRPTRSLVVTDPDIVRTPAYAM